MNFASASFFALARAASAASFTCVTRLTTVRSYLRPSVSVTITMQFRDWGGMYMEHCHNTVHEDNAMLVRWETQNAGTPFLYPLPTPIPSPTGVTFQPVSEILPTA